MTRPTAALLSGVGRYADPWHPFAETTPIIARLLDELGVTVSIAADVDEALTEGITADLLVVHLGQPRDGAAVPAPSAGLGLREYLRSGRPLLGVHVAATSFIDEPDWAAALGGHWLRGVSMHPEQSSAHVRMRAHPVTSGVADFSVFDERYTDLSVSDEVEVLATHRHNGADHPLLWLREANAAYGRAVYDALGHDARSYDSAEHLEVLRRLVRWLLD